MTAEAERFYTYAVALMAAVPVTIAILHGISTLATRRRRRFDAHVDAALAIIRADEQQAREDRAWAALLAAVMDVEAVEDFQLWDAEVES